MDLLSVIVPVYNSTRYIEKCVNSILTQTYPNLEIILVNDGSTDNGGQLCETYSQKYKNITVLHQSNMGSTMARLKGAKHSKGTYITFVDSDDWIEKDYYENMLGQGKNEYDLIISGIYRYYKNKKCKKELCYGAGIYDKKRILKEIAPSMLWDVDKDKWGLDPSLCTKVFKRELLLPELEKAKKVQSQYGDDSMVLFPMMFKVEKMKIVKDAFYYHRQRKKGEFSSYIRDELFLEKLHSVYTYLKNAFYEAGHADMMEEQLERFYFNAVHIKEKSLGCVQYDFFPIFPFFVVKKDSRVILYGAGDVGTSYMEQNEEYNFCNIIFWVDKNYAELTNDVRKIDNPNVIRQNEFDYIVIAIDNYFSALKIMDYLFGLGVPKEKIVWHSTRRKTHDIKEMRHGRILKA